MLYTINGLVIRELKTGENDKLLTLLTPDNGKITVLCKGARSMRNPNIAATQLFSYGNYELYKKNDLNWLRSGSLTEGFYGLREDITALSLASYVCEVMFDVTPEMNPAPDLTRLALNTLHAISKNVRAGSGIGGLISGGINPGLQKKQRPFSLIKGVFELRLASSIGYMPDLNQCRVCMAESGGDFYCIEVMNGALICNKCAEKEPLSNQNSHSYENMIKVKISPDALEAMRYTLRAMHKRMFSFKLNQPALQDFSKACETYLLHHLERSFPTLEFYRTVLE